MDEIAGGDIDQDIILFLIGTFEYCKKKLYKNVIVETSIYVKKLKKSKSEKKLLLQQKIRIVATLLKTSSTILSNWTRIKD